MLYRKTSIRGIFFCRVLPRTKAMKCLLGLLDNDKMVNHDLSYKRWHSIMEYKEYWQVANIIY